MIEVQVLRNGGENNLLSPATQGDFGFDLVAASDPKIVGEGNYHQGLYRSIDYIEYDTNLVVAPRAIAGFVGGIGAPTYENHVTDIFDAPTDDQFNYEYFGKQEAASLAGLIFPRSSISKYNLVLANSVPIIDAGYRGTIKLRFKYIMQPSDLVTNIDGLLTRVALHKIYRKGDKIAQVAWVKREGHLIKVSDELPSSQRATGGFGSSGQ